MVPLWDWLSSFELPLVLLKDLFVTHMHLEPLSFRGQGVTKATKASSQGPSGARAPGGPQGGQMESQARAPLEPGPLHSVEGVPPSVRPCLGAFVTP